MPRSATQYRQHPMKKTLLAAMFLLISNASLAAVLQNENTAIFVDYERDGGRFQFSVWFSDNEHDGTRCDAWGRTPSNFQIKRVEIVVDGKVVLRDTTFYDLQGSDRINSDINRAIPALKNGSTLIYRTNAGDFKIPLKGSSAALTKAREYCLSH